MLIIGASGYLGSEILHQARLSMKDVDGTRFRTVNDDLIYFDVSSPDKKLIEKHDLIVWAAHDVSTGAATTTLKHINDAGKRLVYVSTDLAACAEKINPKTTLGLYTASKITQEKIVLKNKLALVLRVGPVYGKNSANKLDRRTAEMINQSHKTKLTLWSNVYKTFEPVIGLSKSIVELATDEKISGLYFLGPHTRISFHNFYIKILPTLGVPEKTMMPVKLTVSEAYQRGVVFDTSYKVHENVLTIPLDRLPG
jgi:dTDP-4-dehydrorhamnose reductase